MTEVNIIRTASPAEKMDFIELTGKRRRDILNIFLTQLSNKRSEYQAVFRPFDSYGARIDFDKKIQDTIGQMQTTIDISKSNTTITIGDLDRYGDANLFDLVDIEEIKEDKLLDGIRTSVSTSRRFIYKTKSRGNTHTIFVENAFVDEVMDWVKDNFKELPGKRIVNLKKKAIAEEVKTEPKSENSKVKI